jgi:CRISPR-associated endonuclease/helicase Cas3
MSLSVGQFDDFFKTLRGYAPFPWQSRLARRVVERGWPECIDLPTASGKTACIDIAVFVLACQAAVETSRRTVGRRIFFTVNRRVIVDEAFDRARSLALKLLDANDGILKEVADALREISGDRDAPPLDIAQLRGGIYRDRAWARSITQPIIVCTTADQLGSRLLFRGYGVSPSMQPVHAALAACDSLILLDEAHVTRAFCQTLRLLTKYQKVRTDAGNAIPPMRFVQMTATPVDAADRFELEEADLLHQALRARQHASKPATLVKLGRDTPISGEIVNRAFAALSDTRKAIGVIVNRVQTARVVEAAIRARLAKEKTEADVHLVIGRMRPIDRDVLQDKLRNLVGPGRPDAWPAEARPVFVVATQCLEVGADYDFDALITECASIDALRQRFGRLNRKGRPIEATAAIVTNDESIKGDDPIYGDAIKHTWEWLAEMNHESLDFGIAAFKTLWDALDDAKRQAMLAPAPDAAVLLPAHLDALCQTSPQPTPSPDVSYFIHGPQRNMAEVNVCWRADLGDNDVDWPEIVRLLPPTTPECMAVPLWEVRRWMQREAAAQRCRDADVPVASDPEESRLDTMPDRPVLRVVVWRGAKDCSVVNSPNELRPGDTIVVRTQDYGWEVLGHIPGAPTPETLHVQGGNGDEAGEATRAAIERCRDLIDVAEQATLQSRLRVVRRIHPAFEGARALRGLSDPEFRQTLIKQNAIPSAWDQAPVVRLERRPYPYSDEVSLDQVVVLKRLLDPPDRLALSSDDEDDGEDALSERDHLLSLEVHTRHVVERADTALRRLGVNGVAAAVREAARLHDLGKADVRFQAVLAGTTPYEAMMRPTLLAKSEGRCSTISERQAVRNRALLPDGFRHEMLSVQIVQQRRRDLGVDTTVDFDTLLHLIAAHHGHARPFAPVVIDDAEDDLLSVEVSGISITPEERRLWVPSHRLDSGVAERFWTLTRRHGWWGLAWLESILRLADQQASAAEQEGAAAPTGKTA